MFIAIHMHIQDILTGSIKTLLIIQSQEPKFSMWSKNVLNGRHSPWWHQCTAWQSPPWRWDWASSPWSAFTKFTVERSSGGRWQLTACSKARAQVSRDGLHWAHYYPTIWLLPRAALYFDERTHGLHLRSKQSGLVASKEFLGLLENGDQKHFFLKNFKLKYGH